MAETNGLLSRRRKTFRVGSNPTDRTNNQQSNINMNNLAINIRILKWHFQVSKTLKIAILRNDYHPDNNYPHGVWCIYKLFNWI